MINTNAEDPVFAKSASILFEDCVVGCVPIVIPDETPEETEKRSPPWSTMTVSNGSDLVMPGLGVEVPAGLQYFEFLKRERSRGPNWDPLMRIAE